MIKYLDLLEKFDQQKSHIPYRDLLQTIEWNAKRKSILERDLNRCTKCKIKSNDVDYFYRLTSKEERDEEQVQFESLRPRIEKLLNLNDETGSVLKFLLGKDIFEDIQVSSKLYTIDFRNISLHVHHKYYIKSKLPWEYEDNALITLCGHCHYNLHEQENVPIYADESLSKAQEYYKCGKCSGVGVIQEYLYYYNGVCFQCEGRGYNLKE